MLLGLRLRVVGDRGLLKKIKAPLKTTAASLRIKRLRTDHNNQLKDNCSKQEAFFAESTKQRHSLAHRVSTRLAEIAIQHLKWIAMKSLSDRSH